MKTSAAAGLLLAMMAGLSQAVPPANQGLDGYLLGEFRLTYYVVAVASESGEVPIFGPDCKRVIARTSRTFHDSLAVQGSGMLQDGRLLNFEQRCACALPGQGSLRSCYRELDRGSFPWGRGSFWNGQFFWLQPYRSVAVDPAVVRIGTVIYVPELAGMPLPDGTLFNGCLRAEDTGLAIRGQHLDWFFGPQPEPDWLRRHAPPKRVRAYTDSRRCTRAFP